MDLRPARPDDADDVAAFTRDTWPDRDVTDYLPHVFEQWVREDGDGQAFVADDGGDAVGVVQVTMLSASEAWAQGLRIHPEHRHRGLGTRLTNAAFEWARDRDATTVRNLIFSWNTASLGLARGVGFDPCTEFRFAAPTPDPDATPTMETHGASDAAWSFWTGSEARTHLRGLALDAEAAWALSELTRADLRTAADEGRLFVLADGGTRGFALRTRVTEYGDGPTWAEYGVGAWTPGDVDAAAAVVAAVERDAADVGADEVRLLVPESCAWVTDAAAAGADVSGDPDFVLAADLTDPAVGRRGEREGT